MFTILRLCPALLVLMTFVVSPPFNLTEAVPSAPHGRHRQSIDEEMTTQQRINMELKCTNDYRHCRPKTPAQRLHFYTRRVLDEPLESTRFAHAAFEGCFEKLARHSLVGRVLMRYVTDQHYKYDKELICDIQREVVVPFTCLLREYCNATLANTLYAAVYSYGQIVLGNKHEERSLNCTDNYRHDIAAGAYKLRISPDAYLSDDFCKDVKHPHFLPSLSLSAENESSESESESAIDDSSDQNNSDEVGGDKNDTDEFGTDEFGTDEVGSDEDENENIDADGGIIVHKSPKKTAPKMPSTKTPLDTIVIVNEPEELNYAPKYPFLARDDNEFRF